MFGHLKMLWIRFWVQSYTVTPVKVGPRFWKIGVRLCGKDAMMSLLRLFSTTVCIKLSHYMHKVFGLLKMLSIRGWVQPYTGNTGEGGPQILENLG